MKTKQQQMRDLLLLCTKNVHFSCNGDIFTQVDGMAIDSSLGPILASILMVELERIVLPNFREHMSPSKLPYHHILHKIKIYRTCFI